MFRRLLTLMGLAFYGSLDRVTRALFDDLDYPVADDPLASGPDGVTAGTTERPSARPPARLALPRPLAS